MISKSFSTSAKRAVLQTLCPKMSEFCEFLFVLLVAHADDHGRLPGDEFTVKMQINPVSRRKLPDFVAALHLLHEAGLIRWYQVEGQKLIEIVKFSEHQDLKGHNLRPGKLPACHSSEAFIGRRKTGIMPTDTPINTVVGEVGEDSPKPPLSKSNLTESKLSESNLTQAGEKAPEPPAMDVLFEQFQTTYPAHRRQADFMAVQAFLAACEAVGFQKLIEAVEQHKRSEQWQTPKMVPGMKVWLTEKRWNQVLPEPSLISTAGQSTKTAAEQVKAELRNRAHA